MIDHTTKHDDLLAATRQAERWVKIGVLSLLLIPPVKLLEVGYWLSQQQQPLDEDTSGFLFGGFVLGVMLTIWIVLPYQYLFFAVEIIASVVQPNHRRKQHSRALAHHDLSCALAFSLRGSGGCGHGDPTLSRANAALSFSDRDWTTIGRLVLYPDLCGLVPGKVIAEQSQ